MLQRRVSSPCSRLLLAGAVGVFVGDLSGDLPGESEQLVAARQQSRVPHAELSRRLVHRQLHRKQTSRVTRMKRPLLVRRYPVR